MAVAVSWLPVAFVSLGLLACSPQLVDVVNGKFCCEDPTQEGCGGAGGTRASGGSGGSGASATGGVTGGTTGGTTSDGGSTAGSAGAPPTLIHRYKFQGVGTEVIDSVGSANGLVVNTTLSGQGAVNLAGGTSDQYVELPSFILYGLHSVSFEAWVTWNGGPKWQRIFDFGEDLTGLRNRRGTGRSYLFCTPDDGTSHAKVTFGHPGENNQPDEPTQVSSMSAFPVGEMTQLVVVVDEQRSISIFINGGFQTSRPFEFSLSHVYDVNSWLGRSIFAADPDFNGTIQEFRIYNGALDANQVLASFQDGL